MKTITALWQALALVAAISLACTNARAEESYPEWRHANREQSCKVLDAVLPGMANPNNCRQLIAIMESGDSGKAFESCLSGIPTVRSTRFVNIALVGCTMAAYGVGEEYAQRMTNRR